MMWFELYWFRSLLWGGFIYSLLQFYVSGGAIRLFDHANHRSLHQGEVLTGGGFFLFVPLSIVLLWQQFYLLAAVVFSLSLVGVIDDVKQLSARFRFLVQIAVVTVTLWWLGFSLSAWSVFFAVAFLWWLNLFNFMDGANGLVALHAMVTLSVMAWLSVLPGSVYLLVILIFVALLIYLYFNVLLKRLFMGDSGSLPLAFMIGLVALLGWQSGELSMLQIAVIHAVLITDATLTLAIRYHRKERLSEAHRSHLYQRLIADNRPHALVSSLYAVITLGCCGVAFTMQKYSLNGQFLWFIGVYTLLIGVFFHCRHIGR